MINSLAGFGYGMLAAQRQMSEAGIRAQYNAAQQQIAAQYAAMAGARRDMERLFSARVKPIRTIEPLLRIPHRAPVPSLCCLTGRWL